MDTLAPLLALSFSRWKSPVSVDAAGAVELSEIPLSASAIPHMMRLSALIGESPGWRRRWGLRGAGSDVTCENNRGLKQGSPGGRRLSCGSVTRGLPVPHSPRHSSWGSGTLVASSARSGAGRSSPRCASAQGKVLESLCCD